MKPDFQISPRTVQGNKLKLWPLNAISNAQKLLKHHRCLKIWNSFSWNFQLSFDLCSRVVDKLHIRQITLINNIKNYYGDKLLWPANWAAKTIFKFTTSSWLWIFMGVIIFIKTRPKMAIGIDTPTACIESMAKLKFRYWYQPSIPSIMYSHFHHDSRCSSVLILRRR